MSKWEVFKKPGLSKLSNQESTLPERDTEGKTVLSKYFPPIGKSANMTFFLAMPSLKSNETLINLNALLPRNVSGQSDLSCTFNYEATANMVASTLYKYPDNFRAQKALIAAKYSEAQLTVAKDFVFGETNKTPDFLKKFPLGKVPAFEGSDETILTKSNAIAYHVANDELRGGSDAAARAQIVQWMCMADNEINKLNVLMAYRKDTDSMTSMEWELVRTCKYESIYDKIQTHRYEVVDLCLTIKEKDIHPHYVQLKNHSTAAFTKEYTPLEKE